MKMIRENMKKGARRGWTLGMGGRSMPAWFCMAAEASRYLQGRTELMRVKIKALQRALAAKTNSHGQKSLHSIWIRTRHLESKSELVERGPWRAHSLRTLSDSRLLAHHAREKAGPHVAHLLRQRLEQRELIVGDAVKERRQRVSHLQN
jgi:hypothetical protein